MSEGEGVGSVFFGMEGESFDIEEELLGIEGVEVGIEVVEEFDFNFDSIGDGIEGFLEFEFVVIFGGFNYLGEVFVVFVLVEFVGIDDDVIDGSIVIINLFGGRVDDDISIVFDGVDEVIVGVEGVVDNYGDIVFVGNVGNFFEVGDVVVGVVNVFNVDGFGFVVNDSGEVFGFVFCDEFGSDVEVLKEDFELVVGIVVEVGGGNDVVIGVSKSGNGYKLSGYVGGGGNGSNIIFEGGDFFFEYIDGGVYDFGVDVVKFFEVEEVGIVS